MMICTGCGNQQELDEIQNAGFRSCCPERKMVDFMELVAALESIAANGCCDRCQEAALVARAALNPSKSTGTVLGRDVP